MELEPTLTGLFNTLLLLEELSLDNEPEMPAAPPVLDFGFFTFVVFPEHDNTCDYVTRRSKPGTQKFTWGKAHQRQQQMMTALKEIQNLVVLVV